MTDIKTTTFAIDYDATWTVDPEAFRAFAALLRRRGHRVLLVTARVSGHAEVELETGAHVDRVIFSGAELKRVTCERLGEKVGVWIDDNPEMVGSDVDVEAMRRALDWPPSGSAG